MTRTMTRIFHFFVTIAIFALWFFPGTALALEESTEQIITPPKLPGLSLAPQYAPFTGSGTSGFKASYDLEPTGYGRPYFEAGLSTQRGVEEDFQSSSTGASLTRRSRDFTFEAGGGLHIPLDEDISLTGKYRFTDTEDINLGAADLDYAAHEIRFGFSFKLSPDPAR